MWVKKYVLANFSFYRFNYCFRSGCRLLIKPPVKGGKRNTDLMSEIFLANPSAIQVVLDIPY